MGLNSHASREDQEPQAITTCADVSDFFREALCRALSTRGVTPAPLTEHYLVVLLAQLSHDTAPLTASLVELSLSAQIAERGARLEKLRTLGDHALSYSGLFDAHRERHGVARSYVFDVGSRAYRSASQLAGTSGRAVERDQARVWDELGARFDVFAEVLDDVRESTALGTRGDVLSLYERFVKTGSPVLRQKLQEHGVLSIGKADNDVPEG